MHPKWLEEVQKFLCRKFVDMVLISVPSAIAIICAVGGADDGNTRWLQNPTDFSYELDLQIRRDMFNGFEGDDGIEIMVWKGEGSNRTLYKLKLWSSINITRACVGDGFFADIQADGFLSIFRDSITAVTLTAGGIQDA